MTHRVDKILVAKAQLDTAIDLFFRDSDPHSIHTLAAAAYELMDTLCVKKGLQRGVIHRGLELIAPQHHKTVLNAVFKMKAYLKHADRDHDETIEWNPGISEFFIWDACTMYRRLTSDTVFGPHIIYETWFSSFHGDLWADQPEHLAKFETAKEVIGIIGKLDFYEIFMERYNGKTDIQ